MISIWLSVCNCNSICVVHGHHLQSVMGHYAISLHWINRLQNFCMETLVHCVKPFDFHHVTNLGIWIMSTGIITFFVITWRFNRGDATDDLKQNQDFGRRKIWSENVNFETKIKISGFLRSLISDLMVSNWDSREMRENNFGIWKSNFRPQNSKSKSNFRFWLPDFLFFGNPNSLKAKFWFWCFDFSFSRNPIFQKIIEFSNFGRVEFCIFIPFNTKFWKFRVYDSIYQNFPHISLNTRDIFQIFL